MATRAIIPLRSRQDSIATHDPGLDDGMDDGDRGIPIRAISRGISVLQAVNRQSSLTMTQIAADSGVPYPTACRIVKTLVQEGLIEREGKAKRYRPTAKVRTLASGYDNASKLVEVAKPLIEDLTVRIGWPISLTTHVGGSMVLGASTHALTSLTFSDYQPGYAMPMLKSAAGLVFLANCKDHVRNAMMDQFRRFGVDDTKDMVQLAMEGGLLQTIRSNGYATRSFVQHTRNPGKTSSIAVPIMHDGEIEGALTVAFFSSTIELHSAVRELMPELRNCASEISDML